MGFECGFEIARRDNKLTTGAFNLYYLGNVGDYVDDCLMRSGVALDDNDTCYVLDKEKIKSLRDKLQSLAAVLKKYSARVLHEFDDYVYSGENFPTELKKDFETIKDCLFNLEADQSDLYSLSRIISVLDFICDSEIFNDCPSEYWLNSNDYVLRYWRSY